MMPQKEEGRNLPFSFLLNVFLTVVPAMQVGACVLVHTQVVVLHAPQTQTQTEEQQQLSHFQMQLMIIISQ